MTDRIILLAENERASYRGISREAEALWAVYQREDDDRDLTLDYSGLFGAETLSSVTRTAYGTTVSSTSNTTTQAVQSLKGEGYVDIKATSSGAQVRVDRIVVRPRTENAVIGTRYSP